MTKKKKLNCPLPKYILLARTRGVSMLQNHLRRPKTHLPSGFSVGPLSISISITCKPEINYPYIKSQKRKQTIIVIAKHGDRRVELKKGRSKA